MIDELPVRRASIDTYRQPVIYMHEDCHICRAEGFTPQARIRIDLRGRWLIATLNVVERGAWLPVDAAALSTSAWAALGAEDGDVVQMSHPEPPSSVSAIRAKAYGNKLAERECSSL